MSKSLKLISVIVPIYKVEEYLPKCIESIISQTYKNLEIILVDDGSPDNSGKICDEYAKKDKRIMVIHKENGGVSSARNLGLAKAKGEFVAFVDSDDYLEPTMYEKLIAKQQEEDLDIVIARHHDVRNGNKIKITEDALEKFCESRNLLYVYYCSSKVKYLQNEIIFYDRVFCSLWRMMFKKQVLEGISFNTQIRYMEDFVYFNEVIVKNNCKIGLVNDYLYNYLIRQTSAVQTKSKNILNNNKSYLEAMQKILTGSKFEEYLPALEYFCYSECVLAKCLDNEPVDLKEIKAWGSRKNYKSMQKIITGFKSHVKFFLIRHNMFRLLKLLYKIK